MNTRSPTNGPTLCRLGRLKSSRPRVGRTTPGRDRIGGLGVSHFAPTKRRAVATGGAVRRRSRPTRNPWKRDPPIPPPCRRASSNRTVSTGSVRLRRPPPVANPLGPCRGRKNANASSLSCHGAEQPASVGRLLTRPPMLTMWCRAATRKHGVFSRHRKPTKNGPAPSIQRTVTHVEHVQALQV